MKTTDDALTSANVPGDTPRKAVLYVRQSRRRESGASPSAQKRKLQAYAQEHGIEVVAVEQDIGKSGWARDVERPGFNAMQDHIREGRANTLLAYRLDRITRQGLEFWVQFAAFLDRHQALVISIDDRIDSSAGLRGLAGQEAVNAVMRAEQESMDTSARVSSAKAEVRDLGAHMGGPAPYGFSIERRKMWNEDEEREIGHSFLVPNPEQAIIVNEVIDNLLDGATIAGEIRRLNGLGIPSARGKEWTRTRLYAAVRHPAIAGYYTRTVKQGNTQCNAKWEILQDENGESRIAWEPIVPASKYWKLRAQFEGREMKKPRGGKAFATGRGILFCVSCGSPMSANLNKVPERASYRCPRSGALKEDSRFSYCPKPVHIQMHLVDDWLRQLVTSRIMGLDAASLEDWDLIRAAARAFNATRMDSDLARRREEAEVQIGLVMSQFEELDRLQEEGAYSGEMGRKRFIDASARLEKKLAAARERLASLPQGQEPDDVDGFLDWVEHMREDGPGGWSDDAFFELARLILVKVEVIPFFVGARGKNGHLRLRTTWRTPDDSAALVERHGDEPGVKLPELPEPPATLRS